MSRFLKCFNCGNDLVLDDRLKKYSVDVDYICNCDFPTKTKKLGNSLYSTEIFLSEYKNHMAAYYFGDSKITIYTYSKFNNKIMYGNGHILEFVCNSKDLSLQVINNRLKHLILK